MGMASLVMAGWLIPNEKKIMHTSVFRLLILLRLEVEGIISFNSDFNASLTSAFTSFGK